MKTTHIGEYETKEEADHMADSNINGAIVQKQDDKLYHVFQIDSWAGNEIALIND